MSENNKLVECPRCIGTGEVILKNMKPVNCPTCGGTGMASKKASDDFLENEIFNI